MKSLIILYSYHHHNTEKIAKVFSEVLNAVIKTPQKVNTEELSDYDLVGFGSGIYGAKHHKYLFDLVDKVLHLPNKKAFLFSTAAITGKRKVAEDHLQLKEILQSKGFEIINEFQCKGFNTNSFLKYFKGMNKGRPNAGDLEKAKEFALTLKHKLL